MQTASNTAAVTENAIVVETVSLWDNEKGIRFQHSGWESIEKLVKKLLLFNGEHYAYLSWNSDRNDCIFRRVRNVAFVK